MRGGAERYEEGRRVVSEDNSECVLWSSRSIHLRNIPRESKLQQKDNRVDYKILKRDRRILSPTSHDSVEKLKEKEKKKKEKAKNELLPHIEKEKQTILENWTFFDC